MTIIIALCTVTAMAQTTDPQTKELQGVTVRGSRIVVRADGKTIYPSEEQKKNSTTAYGLLRKIALPELRADETRQTVTALSNRGDVQIRINGIMADREQLVAMDCNEVVRIEYTDRPGLRYGKETGYVINFITKRADRGCSAGINATNAITTVLGNNTVFGKTNRGKDQWEASYSAGYGNDTGTNTEQTARYLMPDNTVSTIRRESAGNETEWTNHSLNIIYNRADSGRYQLQIKAGGKFSRTPTNETRYNTTGNGLPHATVESGRSRSLSPTADIYWHGETGRHQNLTLNATYSLIGSDISRYLNEGGDYRYDIDGKAESLIGEGFYENRMQPFTLSAGLRWQFKNVCNTYTGDTESQTDMRSQDIYAFGQISGKLLNISYTAGLGINRTWFRMQPYNYDFTLFHPKASASLPLTESLKISYDFEISQHTSAIANTNDVTIRRNSMEEERGNPALRPNRITEHTVGLSYSTPRLYAGGMFMYRLNDHCNMKKHTRETTEDNRTVFMTTQTNQHSIDMLMWQGYASYSAIPGKLDLSITGTVLRCINNGDDYRHLHTAYNGSATATAYLGPLTVTAYADNGWGFMEGETRVRNGGNIGLTAAYRRKSLSISLDWQNPLIHWALTHKGTLDSRYISKDTRISSRSDADMLTLSVRYTFSRGRKYNDISQRIENTYKDTGIME